MAFPKLNLAIVPWERNLHELAFKYFIFKKRNYCFIADTQTNISKFATESAKAKQVSYIPLIKGPWLMTKFQDHSLDFNQNLGAEKISIFVNNKTDA